MGLKKTTAIHRFSKPAWITLIILVSAVYHSTYYKCTLVLGDVGFLVRGALEVLKGQLPYRDFYSYPPAIHFILAFVFRLLGPSLVAERLMWVIVLCLISVLIFVLARRLMPTPFALIPTALVILVPGAWHKGFFSLISLLNLYLIYLYFEKPSNKRLLAAGAAAGLGFSFRVDCGAYPMISFFLSLILRTAYESRLDGQRRLPCRIPWDRRALSTLRKVLSQSVLYTVGAAIGFMPFAVYYAINSALYDLLYGIFILNPTVVIERGWGHQFYNPLFLFDGSPPINQRLDIFFFYSLVLLPVAILAIILYRLWRRVDLAATGGWYLVPSLLMSIMYLSVLRVTPSLIRVLQISQINYIFLSYLFYLTFSNLARLVVHRFERPRFGYLMGTVGCLLLSIYPLLFVNRSLRAGSPSVGTIGACVSNRTLIEGPRGEVYTTAKDAVTINTMVQYVQATTDPGDILWVPVEEGGLVAFLTDRRASASLFGPHQETIQKLEEDQTELIMLKESFFLYANYEFAWTELHQYITSRYHFERKIGPYLILRRGSETASRELFLGMATFQALELFDSLGQGGETRQQFAERMLQDAVAHFEAAVEGGQQDEYTLGWLAGAYAALGQLYQGFGQRTNLIELRERAVRVLPTPPPSPTYHHFLGNAYMASKAWNEAIAHHQEAVVLAPNVPVYHRALGDAYLLNGQGAEAASEYEAALILYPNLDQGVWFHLRLGKAYTLSHQVEKAIGEYERVLALDPDNIAAIKALEDLR